MRKKKKKNARSRRFQSNPNIHLEHLRKMLYLIILYKWVGKPTGERTDNLNDKRSTQFIFYFQIFFST